MVGTFTVPGFGRLACIAPTFAPKENSDLMLRGYFPTGKRPALSRPGGLLMRRAPTAKEQASFTRSLAHQMRVHPMEDSHAHIQAHLGIRQGPCFVSCARVGRTIRSRPPMRRGRLPLSTRCPPPVDNLWITTPSRTRSHVSADALPYARTSE